MQSRFLDKFSKVALCATMLATVNAPLWAAERTTPVEVKNTPAVTVTNTPNVAVTNVPVVSVTGTPNVAVTNVPTVKIDSTNNIVQTLTRNSTIQLWTSDQTLAATTGAITSAYIDCTGYKEIRVILYSNVTSALLQAKVSFGTSFNSGFKSFGFANFATPSTTITDSGNFQNYGGSNNYCYFNHPVMSNTCIVTIMNYTNSAVTISKDSWVYLVN